MVILEIGLFKKQKEYVLHINLDQASY